jgi:hypothetical protein
MNKMVVNWLQLQVKQANVIESPRKKIFGLPTKDYKITRIENDNVYIKFEGKKHEDNPLHFEMFDKVMNYLENNRTKPVRLGTTIKKPIDEETITGIIWKNSTQRLYKATPFVCDILNSAGLVEYTQEENPSTQKKVQAIKLKG